MSNRFPDDDNPYSSWDEPGGGRPRRDERSQPFSVVAVIIGTAVDIIATMIAGAVLIGVVANNAGMPLEWLDQQTIERMISESLALQIAGIFIGSCCTALGSYVAVRFAGHSWLSHSLGTGILSGVAGILMTAFTSTTAPGWDLIVSVCLILPSALLGGYIWQATTGRKRQ